VRLLGWIFGGGGENVICYYQGPRTPELLVLELDCLLTHSVEEGAVMAHYQQRLAFTTRSQVALHKSDKTGTQHTGRYNVRRLCAALVFLPNVWVGS
jgi:hypothetical protein